MRTHARLEADGTGDSQNIPAEVEGVVDRDQGSASGGRLDHDHRFGERRDDPISAGKQAGCRRRGRGEFTDQESASNHPPIERPMRRRVGEVQA
jgi:hypothetical protein